MALVRISLAFVDPSHQLKVGIVEPALHTSPFFLSLHHKTLILPIHSGVQLSMNVLEGKVEETETPRLLTL